MSKEDLNLIFIGNKDNPKYKHNVKWNNLEISDNLYESDVIQIIYDEDGKMISTIKMRLENISIFRETDWPQIIPFLKDRMINLDEFWCDHKDSFEIFKEL